jgi:hypothetical protein
MAVRGNDNPSAAQSPRNSETQPDFAVDESVDFPRPRGVIRVAVGYDRAIIDVCFATAAAESQQRLVPSGWMRIDASGETLAEPQDQANGGLGEWRL